MFFVVVLIVVPEAEGLKKIVSTLFDQVSFSLFPVPLASSFSPRFALQRSSKSKKLL